MDGYELEYKVHVPVTPTQPVSKVVELENGVLLDCILLFRTLDRLEWACLDHSFLAK